ncbi:MAG: acyl-phosphate glycerol 3-phosphate acyltransferase [Confluentimicrobium sp.]|nr:acyl-phosphate glycerol 3-phosphate acyltransferase [Actibacterium sp.]MBF52743.1 acyl-phosphate glycerol 3-phosphate acyltransferase [Actibacterium sp.]OWU70068.1 glycerol-3-phosphate acyltransferase [Roseovarius sp. 22II1-1F6A]|tara:strand:+ start:186 stop:827 length:642 start_codon:yes stop_codon:yes gene_type:complete
MPLIETAPVLLLVTAVLGYLLGAIPFGIVIARLFGLGDLRQIGSGNIGATNVLRTGNKLAALLTLLLDAGKAGIAVAIGRVTLGEDAAQLAGFAAFLGHLYPVYLGFRGGKGVATFFGTLLVLAWPVGLASGAVWLVMAKLMRYSSLAALVASVSSLIWVFVFGYTDAVLLCAALTALIYLRHAANIARLRQGTEPKIGAEKKAAATSGPDAP